MIQVQSWLKTIDNSGARSVECIRTLGGFHRHFSYPGDLILVAIKRLRLLRKVKVGQIHLALITRARKATQFRDGSSSRFADNSVLLINRKKRVLGTRFFGWVSRNLRRKKYLRILLLCGRHVILFIYPMQYSKVTSLNLYNLSPITEHKKYSQTLHQVTFFPKVNVHTFSEMASIVVSFRFRSIAFSKKRSLAFFLAIELLTHRKCIASLSSRNIQAWKIRKGRLVGCKVTLRKEGCDDFLNTLAFTFPRMEKRTPAQGLISKFLSKSPAQVKLFTPKTNSNFNFTLGELILFYPIELGLGLHPDVRQVQVNFTFTSSSVEERYFFLRQAKRPVLH